VRCCCCCRHCLCTYSSTCCCCYIVVFAVRFCLQEQHNETRVEEMYWIWNIVVAVAVVADRAVSAVAAPFNTHPPPHTLPHLLPPHSNASLQWLKLRLWPMYAAATATTAATPSLNENERKKTVDGHFLRFSSHIFHRFAFSAFLSFLSHIYYLFALASCNIAPSCQFSNSFFMSLSLFLILLYFTLLSTQLSSYRNESGKHSGAYD